MTDKYKVSGMSCAACSARVERAVSSLKGVESCSVNLLTGDMRVEGEVSADTVISAVKSAGYGAELARASDSKAEPESAEEHARGRRGFVASLLLLVCSPKFLPINE